MWRHHMAEEDWKAFVPFFEAREDWLVTRDVLSEEFAAHPKEERELLELLCDEADSAESGGPASGGKDASEPPAPEDPEQHHQSGCTGE